MKNFILITISMKSDFLNIDIDDDEIRNDSLFNSEQYQSVIESLQFLFIYTQFNIVFSVNYLIKKNFTSKLWHWKIVKHTLCYLQSVMNFNIEFISSDNLCLITFSDTNWTDDKFNCKSTINMIIKIAENLIFW